MIRVFNFILCMVCFAGALSWGKSVLSGENYLFDMITDSLNSPNVVRFLSLLFVLLCIYGVHAFYKEWAPPRK